MILEEIVISFFVQNSYSSANVDVAASIIKTWRGTLVIYRVFSNFQ